VTEDGVRLDEPADLLDFRMTDGEMRWRIDGAPALEQPPNGVARVRVGSWDEPRYRSLEETFRDSSLEVRVPELDLTSDSVHDVRIEFLTGTNPLILISGATTVSRTTLRYVVDDALGAMQEADWREGRYLDLAEKVEFLGVRILNTRITEIERSVREALSDPHFSEDDLVTLQTYPDRLAAVESSARSLRGKWPEAKSARPTSGRFPIVPMPVKPNPYGKFVDEAEQDAKDAVGRLSGLISSQQIVLTQRSVQETARFQRVVTIVGATILVPSLVASVFGANVEFHGRDTTSAFWAMLLVMGGGAVVTYSLVRSLEIGAWGRLRRSRPGKWIASGSPVARLVILGVLGIGLVTVGVLVLMDAPGSPKNSRPNATAPNPGRTKTDTSTGSGQNSALHPKTEASPDHVEGKTSEKLSPR
jgi:hypothetical protein